MVENLFHIIIIDDNPAIYHDFLKILSQDQVNEKIKKLEDILIDKESPQEEDKIHLPQYKIDFASQGEEGLKLIAKAKEKKTPYALAFVDIRMPPGWDGVETIEHIFKIDKEIQVVICTAYSDYTWGETVKRLGESDKLLIVKKPFDKVAIQQLVFALTKKWQLAKEVKNHMQMLETKIEKRTNQLNQTLSLMKATLDSTTDGILVIDNKNEITDYNYKFLELMKISLSNKEPLTLNLIFEKLEDSKSFLDDVLTINESSNLQSYTILRLIDGRVFECYSRKQTIEGYTVGSVFCFRDVTDRLKYEENLVYQATHDALTGLPNRSLMFDRLQQTISNANRSKTKFAILFIDLDKFKFVNDYFSHKIGDIILKEIASRLIKVVRKTDTVARMGGDEFVVIVSDLNLEDDVIVITEKLLKIINEPIEISKREIRLSASIGICLYPRDGKTSGVLLRNADLAMYDAKGLGGAIAKFFSSEIGEKSLQYIQLESDLKNAIKNEEFILYFQPRYDLLTGEMDSAEALIRWQHPTKGLMLPMEFIPFSEKTGLVLKIGEWVLENACKQNKVWQDRGYKAIRIAVNISNIQLKSENFIQLVKDVLKRTGLEERYLELEITESELINERSTIKKLRTLKNMGIELSLDDFGTGYSNLSYLKHIAINRIKIDHSFIHNIYNDEKKMSIVKAIISIANNFDLKVTAEGVETLSELRFLKTNACLEAQGFYFSKPVASHEFEDILKKNQKKGKKDEGTDI